MPLLQRVYLDNAATTPVAPEASEAMAPFQSDTFGNPSSLHSEGRAARKAVESSREIIAETLDASPAEILFTSGATEGNNLAIQGLALALPEKRHIVTSTIEHDAVLHPCSWLERQGYSVTKLAVDTCGRIDLDQLSDAIRDDTLVVSIMAGNNEIGTVQPIDRIGRMCHEQGVLFHTDAVQAYGKIPIPMRYIDLLSGSSHKFHGPKGNGFLYVRSGTLLAPLFHGGGHEAGKRSGTENVPGIVGMATAARLAFDERDRAARRMIAFRKRLTQEIQAIPGTRLNGDPKATLPHIVNFSFAGIEGESLVLKLDERGIATSTGSACSSPDLEPSHVLIALGVPVSMIHGSLRISIGRQTTKADIDALLDCLPEVVDELRTISPFKVRD